MLRSTRRNQLTEAFEQPGAIDLGSERSVLNRSLAPTSQGRGRRHGVTRTGATCRSPLLSSESVASGLSRPLPNSCPPSTQRPPPRGCTQVPPRRDCRSLQDGFRAADAPRTRCRGERSINPWHGRDHSQRLYMLLVLSIWYKWLNSL